MSCITVLLYEQPAIHTATTAEVDYVSGDYILSGGAQILSTITEFLSLTQKNVRPFKCTKQKALINCEDHWAPPNCGSSLWNLLHAILLTPVLWKFTSIPIPGTGTGGWCKHAKRVMVVVVMMMMTTTTLESKRVCPFLYRQCIKSYS
jgi:hypothetical protein